MTLFPVLNPPKDCPTHINWSHLDEKWAQKMHGQTLLRLAERGGLSVTEIYVNIHKLPARDFPRVIKEEAIKLVKKLVC